MNSSKNENAVGFCIVLALLIAWAYVGGPGVSFNLGRNVITVAVFVVALIVLLMIYFAIFPNEK